jgi:hypothetical protein
MAERRMFCRAITESDAFLDLPHSAQNLYFHLGINADDDGFINGIKKVQRTANCSDADMELLLRCRFILPFPSGIVVIKHWKMNNYIRQDRYTPTAYQKEFKQLSLKENGVYFFTQNNDNQPGTKKEPGGIPFGNLDGYQMPTEDSIGKDRRGEEEDAPPASPEPPVDKRPFIPPKGVIKASQLPAKSEWAGTELRKAIADSFGSQQPGAEEGKPRYAKWEKEQKAINGICTMVRNLSGKEREMEAAKLILSEFLKLTQGSDKFWSCQPFTPSGLSPLFDRVVALCRKRGGTGPPKDDIVAEYERREAEKEAAKA